MTSPSVELSLFGTALLSAPTVNVRCTAGAKHYVNGRRDVYMSPHGVIPVASASRNLLHQRSHAFSCIHVATHACVFLHFCMFDIAEHPKRTLARCLLVAAIASFASEPMEPVQAPSQLPRCTANSLPLICFPNGSVPWPASTRDGQMYTHSSMLSPILLNRVTTFQVFSPHIQHFRRILKQTRDQPPRRRREKRIVSTGSTNITVAVSYGCSPLRKQYTPSGHLQRVQATSRI